MLIERPRAMQEERVEVLGLCPLPQPRPGLERKPEPCNEAVRRTVDDGDVIGVAGSPEQIREKCPELVQVWHARPFLRHRPSPGSP